MRRDQDNSYDAACTQSGPRLTQMADSGTGAGSTQDEPGASYSVEKAESAPRKMQWGWGMSKGHRSQVRQLS